MYINEQNEKLVRESEEREHASYVEVMEARKLTLSDIKEHFTGPVISVLAHVVLLVFLSTWIVLRTQEEEKDLKIKDIVIQPVEIEEIVPPEEPEEIVDDTDIDVEIEHDSPDVESDDTVNDVDDLEFEPVNHDVVIPNIFTVKLTNAKLIMPALIGSRGGSGREKALGNYGDGRGRRTEKSLMHGLRWLKDHQNADGSWGDSNQQNKPAYTGMALLAFLAHDETPSSVEFGKTVVKAIKKLVEYVGYDGMGVPGGYRHGIATYALCEAYGLTQIPELGDIMNTCVSRIIKGENQYGSFNYGYANGKTTLAWNGAEVTDRCDLSVGGWNYQALKAAHVAGSSAPGLDEAIDKAIEVGLKKTHFAGKGFSYGKGEGYSDTMTAVGTLCLQLFGAGTSSQVKSGLQSLETDNNFWISWKGKNGKVHGWSLYKWYYQTQVIFQGHKGRGAKWKKWNKMFTRALIKRQKKDGRWESPAFEAKSQGHTENTLKGLDQPVYSTALCCLMLEVYYRYLPTFKMSKIKHKDLASANNDIKVKIQ